jgi:asparagine synthase (glutamine-hydrolysing)
MCGIAGIVAQRRLPANVQSAIAAMGEALQHRGPDGASSVSGDHFAMASRRLSIIDLQNGGQPIFNEDRSLALICNGEIYNHLALRRELEGRGHSFSTHSDCETILHLYEEQGDRCVQALRGMFAFALWDYRKQRLLLARDRMGEKPLYLVEKSASIVFASELKALLAEGVVSFALDPDAVNAYFHFGYVPEPMCAVRGVRKLPAGHVLAIEIDPWKCTQKRYWKLDDAQPLEGDPATLIRAELESVSEIIVRSDVPVGVALSGGVDSSVIATLAARKYRGTLQAVTLGYAGHPRQDERKYAREVAQHLKIPLHEVELHVEDVVKALPAIIWHCDDPIGDVAAPTYYFTMKRARDEGLPVMLSGHGGDELFWGYAWMRKAVHATKRKRNARLSRRSSWPDYLEVSRPPFSYTGAARWLKDWAGLRGELRQRAADFASPVDRPVFYDLTSEFQAAAEVGRSIYAPAFASQMRDGSQFDVFGTLDSGSSSVEVMLTRLICESYLAQNGLAQVDRLSMASSVEVRQPFVDYRLVEVVTGLRKRHSDVDLPPKQWLRDAVKDIVPQFIRDRVKRGFTPPWRQWAQATAERYSTQLADGYLVQQGVLTPDAGRSLAQRLHVSRFGLPYSIAEYALSLELWCQAMADAAARAAARASVPDARVARFHNPAQAV